MSKLSEVAKPHKFIDVDFEFHSSNERFPTLVCASALVTYANPMFAPETHEFWFFDGEIGKRLFLNFVKHHRDGVWCGYASIAEARCFEALGLMPTDFQWIDYHSEYKCLLNNNDDLEWGKQLIDGKIVTTRKPNRYKKKGEKSKDKSNQAEKNLAAAVFKMLGILIDTEEKDRIRDIIISKDASAIRANREAIQKYCTSDIVHLPALRNAMLAAHRKYLRGAPTKILSKIMDNMLARGAYAAETSLIEGRGYPVNVKKMRNFARAVKGIIFECQRDINSQFDFKPFRWNKRDKAFSWRQAETEKYLEQTYPELIKDWVRTKTGQLSLSLDAFSEFFNFAHSYPEGNFGAQMVRYLKLKQSLNGFVPKKNPKKKDTTIWDNLGSDGMIRPYTNIYGSQSGRNQPSSKSFIFLKAAWMRVLVEPPKGYMMLGADWSSQEFLIGALKSKDKNMIKAYHSGDPYLWFGKSAKRIPEEGTKATHGMMRDRFKSSVLGIMYLMGAASLAIKITNDTGVFCSENEAQGYIDLFDRIFYDFAYWRDEVVQTYGEERYIMLMDGWCMFGDNDNFRSVTNCPIQGEGAVILRRAVKQSRLNALPIALTLHDALYPIVKLNDWSTVGRLSNVMVNSFAESFPEHKEADKTIRSDFVVWSPELEEGEIVVDGIKVTVKKQYIDERAIADYRRFEPFLHEMGTEDL